MQTPSKRLAGSACTCPQENTVSLAGTASYMWFCLGHCTEAGTLCTHPPPSFPAIFLPNTQVSSSKFDLHVPEFRLGTCISCTRLSLQSSWWHRENPRFSCHPSAHSLPPELSHSSMPGAGPGWPCWTMWVTRPSPLSRGRSHIIRPRVVLGHFCVTHWTLPFSVAWRCPPARKMTTPIHMWQLPGDKGAALSVALPYKQKFSIPRSLNKICPQISLAQLGTRFHFWANPIGWEIV